MMISDEMFAEEGGDGSQGVDQDVIAVDEPNNNMAGSSNLITSGSVNLLLIIA